MSAIVAVLFVRLADETAAFLPAAALEPFRFDLGLTYAQAGIVLALVAPGALVGTVFTVAADRYSRRAIAAGGALGYAASLAAFAVGASFEALAVAAFVLGVASTAMVDAAEVALVDLAGEEDLRPFLARSNLLATGGDLLGPALVAGVAIAGLSWRVPFGVGAGLLAIYAVALALTPLPRPAASGTADEPDGARPSTWRNLDSVLRDRRVWLIGAIALLMGPFDEPLLGFTIALLERERGASTAVATIVAFLGTGGGILAYTMLAKRWADVPSDRLLVGAAVAMATGAAVIAVVPAVGLVTLALFVTDVGLCVGWLAVQHRTLTLRPGQVGTTKAVITAIELVGFAIPAGIGAVADRTNLVVAVGAFAGVGAVLVALSELARRLASRGVDDEAIETRLASVPRERWLELWDAIEVAEAEPAAEHTTVGGGPGEMAYLINSEAVERVASRLGAVGGVVPFAWPSWDGRTRYAGGAGLDEAPVADAVRMATAIIRGERFADGTIAAAIEDGTLGAVVRRLRRWWEEYENETETSGSG